MTADRPRVVIVQRYVTHYRVSFYDRLRSLLNARGVELELVHGFPRQAGAGSKRDTTAVPWAIHIQNRWLTVGRAQLLWEPALASVRDADLVIVEQASSRLLNYVLFLRQLRGTTRMAFWGHGKNFKEEDASLPGEALKRVMTRRVHWWFAYNRLSAQLVAAMGYPEERITDVQNAIDTRGLVAARAALAEDDLRRVRGDLGLPDRDVAVFIGGMYPEKRLPFLIESAHHVRERRPDFTLLLIGAGPDEGIARDAAERHPWIRYLGPQHGDDKVRFLAVAELMLLPGLVGLAVLDAFALELPLVTTEDAPHSPEIAYLDPGVNGVLLPAATSPASYADEVVRLLDDDAAREHLRDGCQVARDRYTIEDMARRFADGVLSALAAPGAP